MIGSISQAVLDAIIREGPAAVQQLITRVDATDAQISKAVSNLQQRGELRQCGKIPNLPRRKKFAVYAVVMRPRRPVGRPRMEA